MYQNLGFKGVPRIFMCVTLGFKEVLQVFMCVNLGFKAVPWVFKYVLLSFHCQGDNLGRRTLKRGISQIRLAGGHVCEGLS